MSDLPTNTTSEASTIATARTIEPFFFGAQNRRLFGCYHEPPGWPARDVGVVICYPQGQEYLRTHRACLHLADRAARAGFPVLRFDYYGSGDSAGDSDEVDLAQWQADLAIAVNELRARSGVGAVVLAGMRLGASLALQSAARLPGIAGVALWDPVINGRAYLDELIARHEELIWRFAAPPAGYVASKQPTELLGFALSATMRTGIEELDLAETTPPRNAPILLIEAHATVEMTTLAASMQAKGARVAHAIVPSFTVWIEDVDKGLVPQDTINAIIAWLDKVFP